MHFYEEIEKSPVGKISEKIDAKQLSLAKIIIDNMTEKFQPQKYKNEYRDKVLKAVASKLKGKKITGKKVEIMPSNVINLMDALQKSVKIKKKKASSTKPKIIEFKKTATK